MKIHIYKDLILEYRKFNAWKHIDSFPYYEILADNNYTKNAKEYTFERTSSNNQDFQLIYTQFIKKLKEILLSQESYCILAERYISTTSRLKSYKGIIPKDIKINTKYIEKEFLLNEKKTSYFISVFILNENNIDYIINNFFNGYDSCCFIKSFINIINESFINNLFDEVFTIKNNFIFINYYRLSKLKEVDKIYRIAGDGGTTELGIQIIC